MQWSKQGTAVPSRYPLPLTTTGIRHKLGITEAQENKSPPTITHLHINIHKLMAFFFRV